MGEQKIIASGKTAWEARYKVRRKEDSMEYLEFQGELDRIHHDDEGITLRLIPAMSIAIGQDNPIYRIHIDQPEEAEKICKTLIEYARNYEIESIGVESGTKLEIYFFDIESSTVIRGSSIEILKAPLEAADYEKHIQYLLRQINEYSKEAVDLRGKLHSAASLICEVERRWDTKLEGHDLSAKEESLHKGFIKALNRVRNMLGA